MDSERPLHQLQRLLLHIAHEHGGFEHKGPREIARLLGGLHPQQVVHHLEQLRKRKYLDKRNRLLHRHKENRTPESTKLVSIPLFGSVDCGPATFFADDCIEGYLRISDRLLKNVPVSHVYALKAAGNSMSEAIIDGRNIEHGDYVLVDKRVNKSLDGEYVVAILDGFANLKKLKQLSDYVLLLSESKSELPPIVIDSGTDFSVAGRIFSVIKT